MPRIYRNLNEGGIGYDSDELPQFAPQQRNASALRVASLREDPLLQAARLPTIDPGTMRSTGVSEIVDQMSGRQRQREAEIETANLPTFNSDEYVQARGLPPGVVSGGTGRLPITELPKFAQAFPEQKPTILGEGQVAIGARGEEIGRGPQVQPAMSQYQQETLRIREDAAADKRQQSAETAATKMDEKRAVDTGRLSGAESQMDRLVTMAKYLKEHPGLSGAVGFTLGAKYFPGTEARSFSEQLQALRSQVAFNTLQMLRENSKTGGALGNVSNTEIGLLEANLGGLSTGQSENEFKRALENIIAYGEGAKQRLRSAYEADHAAASQPRGGMALDKVTAAEYLRKAGGDKEKARQLAASDGYTF